MPRTLEPPGALLVLLRRGATSTDVLAFGGDGVPAMPCSPPQPDTTQWALAEWLCESSWAKEVSRLYATALTVEHAEGRFGVFVGFLDGAAADAPPPPLADWMDLRAAAQALPAPFGETLGRVRAAFVAQSPDEALRVR